MILVSLVNSPSFVPLHIISPLRNILSASPPGVVFCLLVVILELALSPILDEGHRNSHATAGLEKTFV